MNTGKLIVENFAKIKKDLAGLCWGPPKLRFMVGETATTTKNW